MNRRRPCLPITPDLDPIEVGARFMSYEHDHAKRIYDEHCPSDDGGSCRGCWDKKSHPCSLHVMARRALDILAGQEQPPANPPTVS